MDVGEPHCADFVYVRECNPSGYTLRVAAASLAGDEPAAGDATLFPSDHLGLCVKLTLAPARGGGVKRAGAAAATC